MTPVLAMFLGTAHAGGLGVSLAVGASQFLGNFSGFVNTGQHTDLSVTTRLGPVEVGLNTAMSIHNGCYYEVQSAGECPGAPGTPGPLVQGDSRVFSVGPTVLAPDVARLGPALLGVSGAAQITTMPLLMDEQYFNEEVVEDAWGGQNPGYHGIPRPSGKVQVDLGLPISEERGAPVVFLGASASYAVNLDLSSAVVIGLRQRAR